MTVAAGSDVRIGGVAGWAIAALQRGRKNMLARRREKQMELVETLSLGGKRQLALVVCEGRRFLVGMGAESVDAIVPADENGGETAMVERAEARPRVALRKMEPMAVDGAAWETVRAGARERRTAAGWGTGF